MPQNVRNFWLELSVDGVAKTIATGPRSKDGGFNLRILMRSSGGIMTAMNIWGIERDGQLELRAGTPSRPDETRLEVRTTR